MRNKFWRIVPLSVFLLFSSIPTSLNAQNWEIGATLGGALYTGDIPVVFSTAANQTRFGGGAFARYRINRTFAVRLQISGAQLFADEKTFGSTAFNTKRGFSFSTPLYEVAFLPEIRPFRVGNVEPFIFAGVAFAGFAPKTQFNDPNPIADIVGDINTLIDLDKTANFTRGTLAIPIGGGLQWFVNDQFAIGAEVGIRKTFTDYMDGISLSGRPKSKDFYFLGGLTVSYFFGGGNGFSGDWSANGGRGRGGGVRCPSFN
jgi:hypothetical protein